MSGKRNKAPKGKVVRAKRNTPKAACVVPLTDPQAYRGEDAKRLAMEMGHVVAVSLGRCARGDGRLYLDWRKPYRDITGYFVERGRFVRVRLTLEIGDDRDVLADNELMWALDQDDKLVPDLQSARTGVRERASARARRTQPE